MPQPSDDLKPSDDNMDWRDCYALWASVLLEQWCIALREKTATRLELAYARSWFGGRDFRFICGLIGLDSDSVLDRYRRAIKPVLEQENREASTK